MTSFGFMSRSSFTLARRVGALATAVATAAGAASPAQAQTSPSSIGLPIQFVAASGSVSTTTLADYFIAARPVLKGKSLAFTVDGDYELKDQATAPYQKAAGATWTNLKVNKTTGAVTVSISGAKAGDYRVVPIRVSDGNPTETFTAQLPIIVGASTVPDGADYPAPGDTNVCADGFGDTPKFVPAPQLIEGNWFCVGEEGDNDGDGLYNSNDPNPNSADGDNDGLTDREELAIDGLNPQKADTDGDGINDGTEITNKTNPIDPNDPAPTSDRDKDGLSDKQEAEQGTNPDNADSDGDGLSDGDEVVTHKTDPLKADSDGDGFTDGQEVRAGANPLDAADRPAQGSASISQKCRDTSIGWTVPVLVFVPVAIISNLGIAAFKPFNDQVGEVFGNMSADLQRSVGVFSPQLAGLSSNIDSVQAFKVISVLAAISLAIGAVVSINDACSDFFNASSNERDQAQQAVDEGSSNLQALQNLSQ